METIKIKINKLGRVTNSQLELLPFVIFSGESGLGKSYLALLCHYFYELLVSSSLLTRFFDREGYDYKVLSKNFHNEGLALEISKTELERWLSENAINYIGTMLGNNNLTGSIEVTLPAVVPSKLSFRFKEELTGLVNAEDVDIILSMDSLKYRVGNAILGEESPFAFLLRFELITYLFGDFQSLDSSFVFPPSRGPVLTELLTAQTGMYSHFLQDLNELNRKKDLTTPASENMLKLFYKILEGDVKREDNKYLYQTSHMDNPIPISAAAASVREIAPLELLVKKVNISASSLLIEEPEAHLHPLKQRMMADILSAFANSGCFIQVTTHSDYLIRRLNELIKLYKVKEQVKDENHFLELCESIDTLPELCLPSNIIGAYVLKPNGDGSSQIEQQKLYDGVPYITFGEAIDRSMDTERKIEEELSNVSK
jgi:hypothetical protein